MADQIHIFRGARDGEPRCGGSTADQEPLAVELLGRCREQCLDPRLVEPQRNHGGNVETCARRGKSSGTADCRWRSKGQDGSTTVAELASATRAAVAERPAGRDREALAAFVFAWHHHWPRVFQGAFGEAGTGLLTWAGEQVSDEGRYVKLRWIANLAYVL